MMKRTVRQVIFFTLVFLLFFLAAKLSQLWINQVGTNPELVFILTGIIYTLIVVLIYYLAKLNASSEGFWDISEFAKCKGGPYFWQGDSNQSETCKALAETPSGRCGISSYNCPTGYTGQPMLPFYYTPLSNDSWQNERCADEPKCPCKDTGLCSMEKQVE